MATGLTDYGRILVATVGFNAIAVLAISILAGTAGIWSLGHTAFIALGAYFCANLAAMNVPVEVIVPVVAVLAAAVGYLLGLSAGRFSILYFGLLTMAVALTGLEVVGRLMAFTGGDQGMPMGPMHSWLLGRSIGSSDALWLTLALAVIVFIASDVVIKGAIGRRWRAVKSHRMASTSLGLVPARENALAFSFSAAIAAIAGVAGAVTIGYLEPETYNLDHGVMLIAATVIGGISSFLGAVVGAGFVVFVPEFARGLRDASAFALGLGMIIVLLFLPRGIVPSLLQLLTGKSKSPQAQGGSSNGADHARHVDEATSRRIAALAAELMPRSSSALAIDGLCVEFGGLKALQDVSLRVEPGSAVGLIGPNGAGKTTLLNALSGYVLPSSCRAMKLGTEELTAHPAHRRLQLGFGRTFQHAELFGELTIREMVLLAATMRKRASSTDVSPVEASVLTERILGELGLLDVAEQFPEALPFGIQKVADIGRILAMGPSVVALDEPFSGLDGDETRELRAILRGMKSAGVSILIIDHAVQEVLSISDHVVVLDFGQVIATGSPREIQSHPEVQRAYFGSAPLVTAAVESTTYEVQSA
ncbi:branched-chain amino acid ABC transporter ATP-binding protein/permease [Hydrogenophaga sp. BPS33]|uniref:branched-chain amino acid ABC transporter ATP-binding protein/permease n=1 Tax=Hydrogenophaga sp. BPS33 TaxID=2651974 RepID=UPI00131FE231|nr:ATP-binding cassette domain-containing protein [Hydrogenophaga sp. BPS33]QHE84868.1 ATP-binding cassette domain-containing protein [Hydrogenophaga sp. BPS33]